jgi:hypothetical protein
MVVRMVFSKNGTTAHLRFQREVRQAGFPAFYGEISRAMDVSFFAIKRTYMPFVCGRLQELSIVS